MKKLKQIALWIFGIIALEVIILLIVSPYTEHSDEFKTVEASIEIDAPIDSVFAYMSNSAYASDWSSYVDHIMPLNTNEIEDGKVGSIRRVFVSVREKDAHWDEKITEVYQNKKRKLSIYAIDGLAMSADGLLTEQRYEKLSTGKTRLSLVLYFDEDHQGMWTAFKMHLGSFRVRSIFEQNLVNIKREIEARWKK